MFFSLSVSWGGLIMFGSYNKFYTRVHIHATLISSLDFVTSLIAGVVVFSILGNLQCNVSTINSVLAFTSMQPKLELAYTNSRVNLNKFHSLVFQSKMWFDKNKVLRL